jgi:sporulation protein YlmC with PRC-barrel domain
MTSEILTEGVPPNAADRAGHRRLISADRVQGTPVFNTSGSKLGHIETVMLDKASGRVAYAIMSYGGFLGAGERYHPLPWPMLHYDIDRNGYVVPLSADELDTAPTVERDDLEVQDDAAWAEAVHLHYGMPGPFI